MTQTKFPIEADVEGVGQIIRIAQPFDQGLQSLREARATPISARDLAYARIKTGSRNSLSQSGSYVKEGVVYVPDQSLLIRDSPLLAKTRAQKAVESHKQGTEFYIDETFAEKYQKQAEEDAEKEPEKRRVLRLNSRGTFKIPTNRFADEELTLWLFKDLAENYGNFLKDRGRYPSRTDK